MSYGQAFSVGDFNRDGQDDLLLFPDNGFGTYTLYFQCDSRFIPVNLESLLDRQLRVFGGISASNTADINRDGYRDIIIGTRRSIYLLLGMAWKNGKPQFEVNEILWNQGHGHSPPRISSIGAFDINDDGLPDIIGSTLDAEQSRDRPGPLPLFYYKKKADILRTSRKR